MDKNGHMNQRAVKTLPVIVSGLFAATMVGLAIAGEVINYSPIPTGDSWYGVIGFLIRMQNGNYAEWWAQHNEHRIVLSRILFWIDYKYFGWAGGFLIVANYFMVVLGCYVFLNYIRRVRSGLVAANKNILALWLFIVGILFSWVQVANLPHEFQSQVFLAQALPLAALYWLARSNESSSLVDFSIACLVALLSAGAMGNGVLTFPVMFLYALVMRAEYKKCLALLTFAVVVPAMYFYDHTGNPGAGSLRNELLSNPIGLLHYALLYLGSPFYYFVGGGNTGRSLAAGAGMLMVILSVGLAGWYGCGRDKYRPPLFWH
jgi:hypothetical protein